MSTGESSISLARAIEATRIPNGDKVPLAAGTEVIITQALGGSFTVLVPNRAGLYRIESQDADALGREKSAAAPAAADLEEAVWEQLRSCYDPEIPVNIVDLGLIYSLDVVPAEGGKGSRVQVKMTLTAPGCGMGPVIAGEARQKISALSGVASAAVDLVWEPPWSPDRISGEGRKKLGME